LNGRAKSHLSQALGHEACRRGYDVLFVSTHKMLAHLNGGRADGSYDRRFQTYLRPDLLILDDFGLKPVSSPGPEDLLDIILERYERGSMLTLAPALQVQVSPVTGRPASGPTCLATR